jgi:hypothetical protein
LYTIKILKGGVAMKRGLLVAGALLGFVGVGFSYDAELAQKMDALFSQLSPEVIKKGYPIQVDYKPAL